MHLPAFFVRKTGTTRHRTRCIARAALPFRTGTKMNQPQDASDQSASCRGGTSMEPAENAVIVPQLLADQVYQYVERRILDGSLPAGTPLRVRDVAKMVGTSVMPVREAIRRLEENGLAERTPHKGATVKTFTGHELIDIYDVRTVLEVEATRRGAPQVDAAGIARAEAALDRMQRAVAEGDVNAALDEDEIVLRTVYGAAGNAVLLDTIESLWLRCRPYKVIGASEAISQHDNSLWEPQPLLVEAVRRHDFDEAITITENSLAAARRRLETKLETTEE